MKGHLKTVIGGSVVLALLAIAFLVASSQNGQHQNNKNLPISLVGFTNDASGARLVTFALSNVLSRKIGYSPAIDFKERGAWQLAAWPSWPSKVTVPPHQQSVFCVTNPIEGTWRVSVLYELTPTMRDQLGWNLRRLLYRCKLTPLANRVPTEKFKAYVTYGPEMID